MSEAAVSSGADLAAMAPADLFSGGAADTSADTSSTETSSASPAEIETIESPASFEGQEEAAIEEPPQEEAEQPVEGQEEPQQAAPQEELPEGVVQGRDSNGKQGLFVEPSRWKNIYGNHQLVQQVSEALGEPATLEGLQLRNDAYIAQERLYTDLTSGDLESQSKVLDYFFDEMARARDEGEIAGDATVPLAQTFYQTMRDRSDDGFATLRMMAARDLVGEIFQEAAATGDESLWLSAQHLARALSNVGKEVTDISQVRSMAQRMGIPFYTKAEMQSLTARNGSDMLAQVRAENERLRAQIEGRSTTSQAAQFDDWFTGMSQSVNQAVLDEAVKPALAPVEKAWSQFPDDYNRLVVEPLHREVAKTVRADQGFKARIDLLHAQARRAASAQRRNAIGQQIQQAYVNRAKLAADAVKKPILQFAANRLKEQADQNHARRQVAQNRTAPRGQSGTVPRSILPNNFPQMGDVYDPKVAVQQAARLLGLS
jgi:hypothetical protein